MRCSQGKRFAASPTTYRIDATPGCRYSRYTQTVALVAFRYRLGTLVVGGGQSLLHAANLAQAPIGQACSGEGVCRSCVVTVLDGARYLTDLTPMEHRWRMTSATRLACQACITPDAPEHARVAVFCPAWGFPDVTR